VTVISFSGPSESEHKEETQCLRNATRDMKCHGVNSWSQRVPLPPSVGRSGPPPRRLPQRWQ